MNTLEERQFHQEVALYSAVAFCCFLLISKKLPGLGIAKGFLLTELGFIAEKCIYRALYEPFDPIMIPLFL